MFVRNGRICSARNTEKNGITGGAPDCAMIELCPGSLMYGNAVFLELSENPLGGLHCRLLDNCVG